MKLFNVLLRKELVTQLFGDNRGKKRDVVGTVMSVLISGLFLVLFVYLFVAFQSKFTSLNLENEVLILFVALAIVAQIIMSVSRTGNVLYGGDDAKVILPLPISNVTMLAAKLTALWIKELVNSCFFLVPVMVAYGIMSECGVLFYFGVVLSVALASLFIVSMSAIIAPFFIKVKKFFLSKPVLIFLISIIFFGIVFLAYSKVLGVVSDMLLGNRLKFIFNKQVADGLRRASGFMFYSLQIGNFLSGRLLDMLIVLAVTGGAAVGAYFVSSHFYLSYLKSSTARMSKPAKEHKNTLRTPVGALWFKEFTEVFRNPTYMFSYVSVVLTLPALCYLTIGVLNELVEKLLGGGFIVPFAILVLIMFACVCNTFAGDVISREENRIMIVKTIPVSYEKQVWTKVLFALAVAFISVLLSVIVLCVTKTLTPFEGFMVLLIAFSAAAASIMHLVSKDINNPVVTKAAGDNGNVSSAVVRALLFSFVLGGICFVLHAAASFGNLVSNDFVMKVSSFALAIGDINGILVIALVVCLIDCGIAVLRLRRNLGERMRRIRI